MAASTPSIHGITLTPAGQSFYPAAKKMAAMYESARAKGRKIADRKSSLTIFYNFCWNDRGVDSQSPYTDRGRLLQDMPGGDPLIL